jgi:predicted dehydrogenase
MNTIGVIGSQLIAGNSFAAELNDNRKDLIKIYTGTATKVYINKEQFPFTEVVDNVNEIIQDNRIDTVFVSKQKLHLISPAIRAGKRVRVI